MNGFKATDKDMKCLGFQFKIGKWFETTEPLELCKSGFHFCKYPSGVYSYYNVGCRIFEIEAEGILEQPEAPGADYKLVCSRIKFVKEIFPDGDGNTGDGNTGYGNTGNGNTGDGNTGYGNTGYQNTGHGNTGDENTGYGNTGDGNTGDENTGNRNTGHGNTGDGNAGHGNTGYGNTGNRNTGYENTGHGNTGDENTGYGNTGHGNTGHGNTGDGNAGNFHMGMFCQKAEKVFSFDKNSGLSRQEILEKYPEINYLAENLLSEDLDWEKIKNIPGITKMKLASLQKKHLEMRNKNKNV